MDTLARGSPDRRVLADDTRHGDMRDPGEGRDVDQSRPPLPFSLRQSGSPCCVPLTSVLDRWRRRGHEAANDTAWRSAFEVEKLGRIRCFSARAFNQLWRSYRGRTISRCGFISDIWPPYPAPCSRACARCSACAKAADLGGRSTISANHELAADHPVGQRLVGGYQISALGAIDWPVAIRTSTCETGQVAACAARPRRFRVRRSVVRTASGG
jgi:hypothetical protein